MNHEQDNNLRRIIEHWGTEGRRFDHNQDVLWVRQSLTSRSSSCPISSLAALSSSTSCDGTKSRASFRQNQTACSFHIEKSRKSCERLLAKRRGAAVQDELFKNAFDASLTAYDSDGEDGDDEFSLHASSSSLASRDGIEEINIPRKRVRHHGVVVDDRLPNHILSKRCR